MICLAMATNHDFVNKSRLIVMALTNMTPKDRKSKTLHAKHWGLQDTQYLRETRLDFTSNFLGQNNARPRKCKDERSMA